MKADTEQMKMKRIFDEQMLFTDGQKDLIYWKNMFVDLDTKFKEYVTKSERYIKDKDAKLEEL